MGTKTIGLDEEAYERLKAQKREDESFSDTVKRITENISSDWRHSFGKYSGEKGEKLEEVVRDQRQGGYSKRQDEVLGIMSESELENEEESEDK